MSGSTMRLGIICGLLFAVGCQPPALPTTSLEIQSIETAGVHNVFRVSDRIYSGSSPEGDAGFAALAKLGVKTIISVDGAQPDLAAARRHGLNYIHLPFGYDGIPRETILALSKAATTVPGPVFVHCHHGKHRGPTAVAAIQLCTDPTWDTTRAETWLKTAGTDPRYAGLVGLPRSLVRPTPEELNKIPSTFAATAPVPDLTRMMVDIDARWDHLKLAKSAGWKVPKDHPDIDPPHEALQLVEHYRESARLDSAKQRGSEFIKLLNDAETAAAELEQALRAKPLDSARATTAFNRSAAACASCHDRFRDRPVEVSPPPRSK